MDELQTANTNNIYVDCPVCQQQILATEFVTHAYSNHFQFFVVWASYYSPSLLTTYFGDIEDPEDEDLSYEYLMNLCDTIGYHKVGVKNIDNVAPIIITDRDNQKINNEDTCAICLELLNDSVVKRRVKKCGHSFCANCIERWLSENKTCPVCIQRIEDEENIEDQMASISNSRSSSPSSSESTHRPSSTSALDSLD